MSLAKPAAEEHAIYTSQTLIGASDRYEVRQKELFEELDQDLDCEQDESEEQQGCLQVQPGPALRCCSGG